MTVADSGDPSERQVALVRLVHRAVVTTGRGPSLTEILALGGTRDGWVRVARACERRGLLCVWDGGAWRDLRPTLAGQLTLVPRPVRRRPARGLYAEAPWISLRAAQ